MKVQDVMSTNVKTVRTDCKVGEAAKIITEEGIGALPVVDDNGSLLGILTESDFIGKYESIPHGVTVPTLMGEWLQDTPLETVLSNAKNKNVSEVMTANPRVISKTASITAAADIMLKNSISRLPVIENDKIVGIIAKKDIVKAVLKLGQ